MNSPILPVDGPSDLPSSTPPVARPASPAARPASPAARPAGDVGAFVAELAVESAPRIGARRAGPPRELLDQIAAAARIEETLRADGQRLRFRTAPGQATTIELEERGGETVRTLSLGEALDIATGPAPR